MAMYDRTYGPKYNKALSRKQIAVCIRQDLKAAVAAGELPKGCKFSVVMSSYNAIDLNVTALPPGFYINNPEYGETGPRYGGQSRYTVEAERMLSTLKAIHGAYNHDGSDLQSDYFDVNYYGQASFGWRLEASDREALKERLADQRAVTAQNQLLELERSKLAIADYYAKSVSAGPVFTGPDREAQRLAALDKARYDAALEQVVEEPTRFSLLEVDNEPVTTAPAPLDEGPRFSLLEVEPEAERFIDWMEVLST